MALRTKYDFVDFHLVVDTGRTTRWVCTNIAKGYSLGEVKWYGAGRQYCFFPDPMTAFPEGYLKDIEDFLAQLQADREPL